MTGFYFITIDALADIVGRMSHPGDSIGVILSDVDRL